MKKIKFLWLALLVGHCCWFTLSSNYVFQSPPSCLTLRPFPWLLNSSISSCGPCQLPARQPSLSGFPTARLQDPPTPAESTRKGPRIAPVWMLRSLQDINVKSVLMQALKHFSWFPICPKMFLVLPLYKQTYLHKSYIWSWIYKFSFMCIFCHSGLFRKTYKA